MVEITAPNETPTISVVVPVHQDGDTFRRCLRSLSQASPQPHEVLIISDGAGESVERVALDNGFRCLKNSSGAGPAKARNFGAANARGEVLFFVDSDVAIQKDLIREIRRAFAGDSSLAAVIGSYDEDPFETNFLSQYKNLIHHFVHQHSNEATTTFWGACGAIRRSVFLELGGFDETYRRPCVEDIEFGHRLTKAGHSIRLLKNLQCKHLKKWSIKSLLKTDLLDRAIPWTELILRDRMLINDLNLRLSSRISVLLVFLCLGLLGAGFWNPVLAKLCLLLLAIVLIINIPIYRFFLTKRKLPFMLAAIPWHLIYYFCCGLGFMAGSAHVFIKRISASLGKIIVGKRPLWLRKSV